jgi:tetratricopeptide (TPR) repeat protein
MTKENILFVIVGLLLGFMVGFFFANSVNQGSMMQAAQQVPTMQQPGAGLPSGHPAVQGAGTGGGAIPEVQAAIDKAKQNPTDFDAQVKAAELYYQIQRFDGATEFLKKASELQPDNYDVIVNLGNAYFDAGKYEDAEKSYTKALAKKSDDLNVRTDLGLTFVFRDSPNYERAVKEFKQVLEADANHVQALQNLTVAYTKQSDKPNAVATLARLEQADATNSAIPKLREEIEKLGSK